MPGNGAQMYTFQLDSEAAEKVNDGHYRVTLSPSLELPILSEPQAMVRSVVFSNSFANVQSKLYQNAKLDLEWTWRTQSWTARTDVGRGRQAAVACDSETDVVEKCGRGL